MFRVDNEENVKIHDRGLGNGQSGFAVVGDLSSIVSKGTDV